MKKQSLVVITTIIVVVFLAYTLLPKPMCSLNSFDKRAVWVSYQELSRLSYNNEKKFEKQFRDIVLNAKDNQCNTLIVHVRAFNDALYPSKYFRISKVITGRNYLSFDPLKIMVECTHQEGLKFEAWINPYRTYANDSLPILKKDGQIILNPSALKVRQLIVNGVKEVVDNYNVDGIHFDDYFYIEGMDLSHKEMKEHVNLLIKDVHDCLKNKGVDFGVSPQGNLENCETIGADINTWIKEGYVDYIMPQIYWSDNHGKDGKDLLFSRRAKQWQALVRNSNVKLYVGLAIYKVNSKDIYDPGWQLHHNNIAYQIQKISELGYDGYSLFDYQSMMSESGQKEMHEVLRLHAF